MLKRSISLVAVTAAAVLAPAPIAAAEADLGSGSGECAAHTLDLPSGTIAGELCLGDRHAETLILTLHGGTYGSVYWDFPYQPETYSFVRAMTQRGYSVLNIDRLGNGDSERPLSATLTQELGARSAHEVVQAARAGDLGAEFDRVVLAGHSVGSTTTETVAARYGDVDGIIVTGLTHNLNEVKIASAFATFYPAAVDPRFVGAVTDPGYLTTRPGTRGNNFYHLANVDPAVVALDEETKETATAGELATFYPFIVPGVIGGDSVCTTLGPLCSVASEVVVGPTPEIDVPVLFVLGEEDTLMCGGIGTDCSTAESVERAEAPYWRSSPCLTVEMVPNAGHNLNLQRNAPVWYESAGDWLDGLADQSGGAQRCA